MKDFLQSETRGAVLSHDEVEILQTERDENGVIISEDYFVQKKKGSVSKAIMHGVLDLATPGLWEIVGTPVEMSKGEKKGDSGQSFLYGRWKNDEDGIHKLVLEFENPLFFGSQRRELYAGLNKGDSE